MDRRQSLVDAATAVVLTLIALVVARSLSPSTGMNPREGWHDILVVAVVAPIAVRRRYPIAAYVVVVFAALALWSTNSVDGGSAVGGAFLTYGMGYYADRRLGRQVYILGSATLSTAAVILALVHETEGRWFQCASRIAIVLGPYFYGDAKRTHNELLDSLRERALRAELDRAREAKQAVADERARIALELHDVVAHSLSVMVVQSTAAGRLASRDPARAAESIANVAETGRAALAEMRRILGVLDHRTGDDPGEQGLVPQPGLGDIDALIERCRGTGMDIEVHRRGADVSLGAGVELAVYRVIQEALTNVLKHAGTARVQLQLLVGDGVVIEVADDGRGLAAKSPDGGGRGVIGMRTRVESVGGELHTGPRAGGGFVVRAVIPRNTDAGREMSASSGSSLP